jgi:transposase
LRGALTECGHAAARARGTYLSERYRQVIRRRGKKKAIVAVGHEILTTAWYLLSRNQPYREVGAEFVRTQAEEAMRLRAIRQLMDLGHVVTLAPAS